jgi:hypothetical protein
MSKTVPELSETGNDFLRAAILIGSHEGLDLLGAIVAR